VSSAAARPLLLGGVGGARGAPASAEACELPTRRAAGLTASDVIFRGVVESGSALPGLVYTRNRKQAIYIYVYVYIYVYIYMYI